MKHLLLLFGLFVSSSLAAQDVHLKAYSGSSLREFPKSGSAPIPGASFAEGDLLKVLDTAKQVNGYYHAAMPETGVSGWVYRSLVQRINAPFPIFQNDAQGVDIYIVDVGAGLGCIIKTPAGKFIIYDGGNSDYVNRFLNDLHPKGDSIDLVIVSHTDSDHWRAIDDISEDYTIRQAIYTSYRPGGLISTITTGIEALKAEEGIVIKDLAQDSIVHGSVFFEESDFTLTLLSGFGKHNSLFADDIGKNKSKLRNAASLVVKLDYKDKSVLFTGDIKGMKDCDSEDCDCEMECISTEKYLLDSLESFLDSDVILAAHHGARNASCPDFIEAVSPEYVIFSAGDTHKHPHKLTATNYLNHGVALSKILRTDIGKTPEDADDNSCNDEWVGANKGRIDDDVSFDDHIRIQITERGKLNVGYLNKE